MGFFEMQELDSCSVDDLIQRIDKLKFRNEESKPSGELEKRLEQFTVSLSQLKDEELATQKHLLEQKEEERKLKEQLASLRKYKKSLQRKVGKMKTINKALAEEPLTEHDISALERCKRKLNIYEECTGIVFDYHTKDAAKGFISNKKTNYLKTFTVRENVTECIWNEMSKGSREVCSEHSRTS